jgi:hypothetical protein
MKPYIFKNTDSPEIETSLSIEFVDKDRRFGLWFDKDKSAGWFFVSRYILEESGDMNDLCGELSKELLESLYEELGRILDKKGE